MVVRLCDHTVDADTHIGFFCINSIYKKHLASVKLVAEFTIKVKKAIPLSNKITLCLYHSMDMNKLIEQNADATIILGDYTLIIR